MRISQSLIDEMVAHARADLPNECCGMVGGADGEASVVVPVVNSAASPLRFEMDPQGQHLLAVVFDRLQRVVLALRVHLETQRAGGRVDDRYDHARLAIGAADHAAALVGQVGAGVRDHLVDQGL